MTKTGLATIIAERHGFATAQMERIIEDILDTITGELKAGGEVNFQGFGKFKVRVAKARMGINPQKPQEKIPLPERIVPKFSAGVNLKKALK